MQSWGIIDNNVCVLRSGGAENHSHLFFACPFSYEVWSHDLGKNNITRAPGSLPQELEWLNQNVKGKGFLQSVCKASLAATIYHL